MLANVIANVIALSKNYHDIDINRKQISKICIAVNQWHRFGIEVEVKTWNVLGTKVPKGVQGQ